MVDWVDITDNSSNMTPLISYNTEPTEKVTSYTLEKYSSIPGKTYSI